MSFVKRKHAVCNHAVIVERMNQITSAESHELKACFDVCDIDESGDIDVEELTIAAQALGLQLRPEQLTRAIAEHDRNHNGRVSFPAFCELFVPLLRARKPEQERRRA